MQICYKHGLGSCR